MDRVIVYGLVLIEAIFHFWFVTVVATLVIGLGVFVWIRFVHFPPIIEAYDRQVRRARYLAQERASTRYQDASRPSGRAVSAAAVADRSATRQVDIRRFGPGNRRPEGPPGTAA